jgi:hypothetical protein
MGGVTLIACFIADLSEPGVDVTITIFGDFRQFSANN